MSSEILDWFRARKVEISAAIKDLFPFLYDLRDKTLISEEDFQKWHDKVAANPNDIQRVVYEVLESIQNNLSAIKEIFCSHNLEVYQDLRPLYQENTWPLFTPHQENGVSRKSIEDLNGNWFSPPQFQTEGGRQHWKNWRRSIQCGQDKLDTLIKNGVLPEPPQNSIRIAMSQHDDVCIVCKNGDSLICCSSCPRSFHEDCHIPKISAEKRNRWKCTFCRCKKPARTHEEHRVLTWQMRGMTVVRCEFLLLNTWCQPNSFLFVDNPATIPNYNAIVQRPMWLKRIAEKLHKAKYNTVGDFIKDMRLMFKNFQKFYKDNDMVEYGRELQAEFENNFREVFSIL